MIFRYLKYEQYEVYTSLFFELYLFMYRKSVYMQVI